MVSITLPPPSSSVVDLGTLHALLRTAIAKTAEDDGSTPETHPASDELPSVAAFEIIHALLDHLSETTAGRKGIRIGHDNITARINEDGDWLTGSYGVH